MYLWYNMQAIKSEKELIRCQIGHSKEKSVGDLTVKIEGKEWADAVKKAFNKIAKNVSINGSVRDRHLRL